MVFEDNRIIIYCSFDITCFKHPEMFLRVCLAVERKVHLVGALVNARQSKANIEKRQMGSSSAGGCKTIC